MAIERRFQLTRRCLKVLSELHVPTYVCTKASPDLISRDLDLMASFQADFTVVLGLSNLSQIEHSVDSSKTENVKFAEKLYKRGIKVWAFIMPVLPGIIDVHAIMQALPEDVPVWLFNLQGPSKGVVDHQVLKYVARKYPHLKKTYQQLYDGAPDTYYKSLQTELPRNPRVKFPYN